MQKNIRKIFKILGYIVIIMILFFLIVPLFIQVKPLEGLNNNMEVAFDESNFVTIPFEGTDGIDIHYIKKISPNKKSNINFILLHGSLFNSFTWQPVIEDLSEYGNVFAYDQIPYGLSEKLLAEDWGSVNPYESKSQVNQLFSFIETLELDNVVLIGNSYGATIALQATLSQPEKIRKLILVDPAIYIDASIPEWLLALPQVQNLGPLFSRTLGQSDSFYEQTYYDKSKISSEQKSRNFIGTKVNNWDYALWEYLKAWKTDDTVENLYKINTPSLIIFGSEDKVVPIADGFKLKSALDNSKLDIIPKCGHVPQEECPKEFMHSVSSWLDT